MNKSTRFQHDFQLLYLAVCALFFISLLYSPFLLSISMFGMGVLALCDISLNPLIIQIRPDFWSKTRQWLTKPEWWIITLPFFVVLFGGLYSEDSEFWLSRLRLKVPFLLLPLAWFQMRRLDKETYFKIFSILIFVLLLSSLEVLWKFVANYEQMLFRLQRGHVIYTPGNHIRYSLLIAICCVSAFILYRKSFRWFHKYEPKLYLIISLYFFLFAHVLAVRSGIGALYLTILMFLMCSLFTRRRAVTVIYLALLTSFPIVAYHAIPSFRNKVQYMIEDFSRYRLQKWNAYSDSERLLSLRAGWDITTKNWAIGVGPGDLRNAMKDYFEMNYDKNTYLLPHNQWITTLAGSGAIGFILLFIAYLFPIVYRRHYREVFFLAINAIIFFSLFAENTFENSRGVAIYIFLLLSGLKYIEGTSPTENSVPDP